MDTSSSMTVARVTGMCTNCTIIQGSTYIADESGRRLTMEDGAYLHHILMMSSKLTPPFYSCETWNPLQKLSLFATFPVLISAGVEQPDFFFTTADGKFNSGSYVRPNDEVGIEAEAINYNKEHKKWHIAMDYEYVEGKPVGLQDVSAAFFNAAGCAGLNPSEAAFYGPPGQKVFNSSGPSFKAQKDGTIINMSGHLHDGGDRLEMRINGEQVCNSVAGYDVGNGNQLMIKNMTACPPKIPVKTGDIIEVKAVYNLEKHPL
jgi:hypothetical protein